MTLLSKRLRTACTALLVVAVVQSAAFPQTSSMGWSAIQQTVTPGARITVDVDGGRSIEGGFAGVSESTLTITRGSGNVDVDRKQIARVYRHVPRSKKKGTLVGLAVGAVIGTAIGVGLVASSGDFKDEVAPVVGGIGAGLGALIGRATTRGTERVQVYSRN